MTTKTKAIIAVTLGGICVALGLIYGVSGQMLTSIPGRTENIARWEKELRQDQAKAQAYMDDVDKLGKSTDRADSDRFESALARMEQMTQNLRLTRERIEHERERRKEQTLITAGLAGLGVLAILAGILLLRRRRS